jgi:hypothetical protein
VGRVGTGGVVVFASGMAVGWVVRRRGWCLSGDVAAGDGAQARGSDSRDGVAPRRVGSGAGGGCRAMWLREEKGAESRWVDAGGCWAAVRNGAGG